MSAKIFTASRQLFYLLIHLAQRLSGGGELGLQGFDQSVILPLVTIGRIRTGLVELYLQPVSLSLGGGELGQQPPNFVTDSACWVAASFKQLLYLQQPRCSGRKGR